MAANDKKETVRVAVMHRALVDFKTLVRHALVVFKKGDVIPDYLVQDLKDRKCPIVADRVASV